MGKREILTAALLAGLVGAAPASAQETKGIQFPAFKSIEAHGDVWMWFFNPYNSYLTDDLSVLTGDPADAGVDMDFHWMEFIARLGLDFEFDDRFGGQFRPLYAATINQDYFFNPSFPDVRGGTVDRFVIDLANVHANGLANGRLDLTFGRQEFSLGQGFVFSDGFNEVWASFGFPEGEYPAVWIIPRISWDAARARIYGEQFEVNLFASLLSETWGFWTEDAFSGEYVPGSGSVLVGDVAWKKPEGDGVYGEVAGGVYFVNQENEDRLVDLHNTTYTISHDIVALDARVDLTWPQGENGSLNVSGEVVFEPCCDIGDENVVIPVEVEGAFGAHADVVYTVDQPTKPFIGLGVRYYTGDDPTTPENEAYNPLFYGFYDWGKWYQGNVTGELFLFNQNELILTPYAGISTRDGKHLFRAFVFHVRLDEPEDEPFLTEVNLLWDYTPTDHVFGGLEFEAGVGHDVLEAAGFDQTQYQVMAWVGFTF